MKFLENKKIRIAIIIIIVLILAGVVIGIALNGDKNKADKGDAGQDIIVHEKEDNTKEESDEAGLIESDSEDGPILKEENIIDYSGGEKQEGSETAEDSNKDESNKNDSDKGDSNKEDLDKDESNQDDSNKDESNKEESDKDNSNKDDTSKDEGTKDTGSWGAFY